MADKTAKARLLNKGERGIIAESLGFLGEEYEDNNTLEEGLCKAQDKVSFKAGIEKGRQIGRGDGVQAVIDYLKNEITTQDKRTAGIPNIKAHLNAVEKCVLQTVIFTLGEYLKEQALKEGKDAPGRV